MVAHFASPRQHGGLLTCDHLVHTSHKQKKDAKLLIVTIEKKESLGLDGWMDGVARQTAPTYKIASSSYE